MKEFGVNKAAQRFDETRGFKFISLLFGGLTVYSSGFSGAISYCAFTIKQDWFY